MDGVLEIHFCAARARADKQETDQMLMQTHEARLKALREELKRRELDGFIVPISDEHMSEYVGEYAQRLGWLTGFGGDRASRRLYCGEADQSTSRQRTIR